MASLEWGTFFFFFFFFAEVTFEMRSYTKKGASHAKIWRKSTLGKGNALVVKAFEK